jgi:hypothetical protein
MASDHAAARGAPAPSVGVAAAGGSVDVDAVDTTAAAVVAVSMFSRA